MLRNSIMLSEERKVKNSTALHFIKFKIQNSKDMKYQYTVKGVDYEVEIQDIEGNIANVTVNGIPFEVEMKQPVKAGKQKVKLGRIANEGASSSSSAPQSAKASADLQSAASSGQTGDTGLYQRKKENNIMFRTIRNKKSEISIDTAKALLQSSRRGVLAVNGDDGYPYAIPINYFYDDDAQKLYFHGARAGYKVDALRACDKVCFTVYGNETIKEEDWAPFVQSVVVFGRCHLVESGARATTLLKQFAMKYYPSEQLVDENIAHEGKAVQIFEIEVEYLSGKEIQER